MQAGDDIEQFLADLEALVNDPTPLGLTAQTRFRELPGWDSLRSLIVVASLQEHYDIGISDQEFASVQTVRDLFELVQRKRGRA